MLAVGISRPPRPEAASAPAWHTARVLAPRAGLTVLVVAVALATASPCAVVAQRGPAARASARRAAEDRATQRALERAEQAVVAGRLERALGLLDAAARRVPRDPRAALRHCELAVPESDDTTRALADGAERVVRDAARCEELLVLHGDAAPEDVTPELAEHLAWARALQGDRAPALARAASRRLDERDIAALRRIAVLALRDGALEEAATALVLARRVRPSDVELMSELGTVRLAQGDAGAAVTLFRSVLAARPDDLAALHDLAGACLQAGETRAAVRYLEALTVAEPAVSSRWLELALARIELGAHAQAAADARRAAELAASDDVRPLLALGDALRLSSDPAGARAAYEDAVRRDPASIRARRALEALDATQ